MGETYFDRLQTFAGERIIDWKKLDFQKYFAESGFPGVAEHIMRALNINPQYITPERESPYGKSLILRPGSSFLTTLLYLKYSLFLRH